MRPLPPMSAPGITGKVARVVDLKNAGVSHGRLYSSDQVRTFHGIVPAPGVDPRSFDTRVAAAKLLLREGMFISRRSAARLLGIPVYSPGAAAEECIIEIGAVLPVPIPRRWGLASHQLRPGALNYLPSAPTWLPTPAEVLALLAAVSTVKDLVIAGDFLVSGATRWSDPLCSLEDLERAAARFAGCRGNPRLRKALPFVRTGVESPAETKLRLEILRWRLPEPQTNCPVPTIGRLLHADLGYEKWKIAIEHEGEYHFKGGAEQARRDVARFEAMHDAGWRVLRTTAFDLRDSRPFSERLRHSIRERSK